MTHMLFAPTGTVAPKFRGTNYRNVHADLRAQYRRDEIRRTKSRRQKHLVDSAAVKQCGAP